MPCGLGGVVEEVRRAHRLVLLVDAKVLRLLEDRDRERLRLLLVPVLLDPAAELTVRAVRVVVAALVIAPVRSRSTSKLIRE